MILSLVPPLKLTRAYDLKAPLSAWLDEENVLAVKKPQFRSVECAQDLAKLSALRNTISSALTEHTNYDSAVKVLASFYEYHASLVECETQGFPVDEMSSPLELQWSSAFGTDEVHASLTWERANILWVIVALETYQASKQPVDSRTGLTKAKSQLEKGAGILRHLRTDVMCNFHNFNSVDFSLPFLSLWESFLLAEAQRCSYEAFQCGASKPRHFMLAKLAKAAAPLYQECEKYCREEHLLAEAPAFVGTWDEYVRAWGCWMNAKGEHHQACTHQGKNQTKDEALRLEKAVRFGNECRSICDKATTEILSPLAEEVKETMEGINSRLNESAVQEALAGASGESLPEIPPQHQVKKDQPLETLLPPNDNPLFATIMNPSIRRYVDLFLTEMDKLLCDMTAVAEEKTESARKALATVNLPHSLTAYRQEQSGGGIPQDLWLRVQDVQREKRVARLKQALWELRDIAETARHIYKRVEKELDDDLVSDKLFREQHPTFEGHEAAEVQSTFRESLENYDRLLVTAQDGDSVLLRRLEMLDTDPKYKLLQFQKSQLDRLLPGSGVTGATIDTSLLSKLLVELSNLFRQREMILNTMKEELKNYDIQSRLSAVDRTQPNSEKEFRRILIEAKESFSEIAYDIQDNINKQAELVNQILVQNEKFMHARDSLQSSSSSDNCIVMIEDAIEEIDQLSKHLKEGKDFYDVVIPKLEKLTLQVGDVSARLTMERCDFADRASRSRQEEEDARMAASFADEANGGGDPASNNGNSNPGQSSPQSSRGSISRPGVEAVSHDEVQVRVDDEKVASLVAMDFDLDKIVEALRKYDNNVDRALNDLLG